MRNDCHSSKLYTLAVIFLQIDDDEQFLVFPKDYLSEKGGSVSQWVFCVLLFR